MSGKTKKPQFKNPFDLDEDEEDQIIPIQTSYHSNQKHTVHNPLPFNPYQIQKQAEKKTQKIQKSSKVKQPQYTPGPIPSKIVTNPFQSGQYQIPTRDYEASQEKNYQLNQDGDPPLLQDIGIQPQMIKSRIMMILKMSKPSEEVIEDPDLSGPILIALCFGVLLLLSGKIHFGDIYAIFVFGNLLMYFLFNFMSQIQILPLYSIMSTVGYAMLPMLLLSFLGIFSSMKGTAGILLSLAISGWCSLAASNFIQALMKHTNADRKALLIYPMFLFYLTFALIIIF